MPKKMIPGEQAQRLVIIQAETESVMRWASDLQTFASRQLSEAEEKRKESLILHGFIGIPPNKQIVISDDPDEDGNFAVTWDEDDG